MDQLTHELRLALDIGNSSTKAGVFRGGELLGPVLRFSSDDWQGIGREATNRNVDKLIYCSVANVPPPTVIAKWTAGNRRRVYALDPTGPLPFTSRYETPHTLGQDRLGAVAGAVGLHERRPLLVVDAGSCMTLDFVDASAVYYGGNISPGLRMRLRAMHDYTARLPLVEPTGQPALLGTTTASALVSGGQYGMLLEVEGLYARLLEEHPGLLLLLTGGDAAWLASQINVPFYHYPDLVLRGLNRLLDLYAEP